MLNLSPGKVDDKIEEGNHESFLLLDKFRFGRILAIWILILMGLGFILLFLPWTQTVRGSGEVTSLRPEQRPQKVVSNIGGRIDQWFVREGEFVEQGDTLLKISEIKSEYWDPELLPRTRDQINAKKSSADSYSEKVNALENQIAALTQVRNLKVEQAKNKIQQSKLKVESDSIALIAADTNLTIAVRQLNRTQSLYDDGLKSLTDLEAKKIKLRETQAKRLSAQNKLLASKNQLINAKIQLSTVDNEYLEKISKANSDRSSALSAMFEAQGTITKMENQYTNYAVRSDNYYILAPQDGYVTKAIKTGIGETIKDGENIVSIMPAKYELAVEMYIEPIDLPLMHKNAEVRFMFDGWPALVFSGWPGVSTGTFGGRVLAIDNFISENGKYRILVQPDPDAVPWPEQLRVGSGAKGLALMQNVPVWYEIWRQINGFPPNFYQGEEVNKKGKKETDLAKKSK